MKKLKYFLVEKHCFVSCEFMVSTVGDIELLQNNINKSYWNDFPF